MSDTIILQNKNSSENVTYIASPPSSETREQRSVTPRIRKEEGQCRLMFGISYD